MSRLLLPVRRDGAHYVLAEDWQRAGLGPIAEADLLGELDDRFALREEVLMLDGALRSGLVYVGAATDEYCYVVVDANGDVPDDPASVDANRDRLYGYFAHVTRRCEFAEGILPEQRAHLGVDYLERGYVMRGEGDAPGRLIGNWRDLPQLGRVLLVGQAGAGKTSLLRKIALGLIAVPQDAAEFALPVYVQLRDWAPDSRVNRLIRHELTSLDSADLDEDLKLWAESGRLVFLLDGFDEVPSEYRAAVEADITEIVEGSSLCRYIVSARPSAKPDIEHLSFREVEVYELNFFQQRELCWRRLPDAESPSLPFWNRLVDEPQVAALATNPLILTLLIARFLRDSLSPHFVGEVVMLMLEALTDEWDSIRGVRRTIGRSLSPKVALSVLRRLALTMPDGGSDVLSDAHCARVLNRMTLPAPPLSTLAEIEAHSGLLRRTESGGWQFSHRAVRDYLHATSLSESQAREAAESTMPADVWRYTCSYVPDATSLLLHLTGGPYNARFASLIVSAMSQRLVVSKDVIHGFCLSAMWLLEMLVEGLDFERASGAISPSGDSLEHVVALLKASGPRELDLFNFSVFVSALRNVRDGFAAGELRSRVEASHNLKIGLLTPFLVEEGRLTFQAEESDGAWCGVLTLVDG